MKDESNLTTRPLSAEEQVILEEKKKEAESAVR